MPSRFRNKVALVTGATSGIGRATAIELAAEGAQVVVSGRRSDKGEAVVAEIRAAGADALFVRADVCDMDSVAHLIAQTVKHYGRLDVAFNNAGIPGDTLIPTAEQSEANWEHVLDTNLMGVWRCMKHEIRQMRSGGGGAIV